MTLLRFQAAMVVGACVVPGAVGGMALGSWCVTKMHGSVHGAMTVCVVSTFLVGPFSFVWQITNAAVFFPTLIVTMVLIFANHVPNTHILINVLSGAQQGTGLGLQNVFYRVFGSIPGPIMFGSMIDSTCLKWEGHCIAYDEPLLRSTFTWASAISAVISAAFFLSMKLAYEEPMEPVHVELDEITEDITESEKRRLRASQEESEEGEQDKSDDDMHW